MPAADHTPWQPGVLHAGFHKGATASWTRPRLEGIVEDIQDRKHPELTLREVVTLLAMRDTMRVTDRILEGLANADLD